MSEPTCVIYNPFAGRGRARRLIDSAVARFGNAVELRPTEGPGHAIELAEAAARSGFARVAAAGGDGTAHEVANGLLRAGPSAPPLAVLPLGSSNDYAHALGRVQSPGSPRVIRVDVGSVRGGGQQRFFVNCLGVGFNGMVTLEARRVRRLRGLALYTTAFLRAGWRHFRQPSLTVHVDDDVTTAPTLALSVGLGPKEGGFPIFPEAQLDDGLFDTLHAAGLRRWHLLRYLPSLIAGRLPADHPNLRVGRCRRVEVRAVEPLCVHADGELVSTPDNGYDRIEIDLLPARLAVEVGAVASSRGSANPS